MDSRDILKQRKLLLQKQRDAIVEASRAKQEALAKDVKVDVGMDKFVPPQQPVQVAEKRKIGLKGADGGKTFAPKVKPSFEEDEEAVSPRKVARPAAEPARIKSKPASAPDTPFKMVCIYFDGSNERKFSLEGRLSNTIHELLLLSRRAYAPLQCMFPGALLMVKEGFILPHEATVNDLTEQRLFCFLSPDTMNDSARPARIVLRSWWESHRSRYPANQWKQLA